MKKSLELIFTLLTCLCFSACNAQAPSSPPPAITVGSLDSAEAYLRRGDQYSEIRDFDHAIADYSQAIRLKPNYPEAYNNRGLSYSLFGKIDMPKAIADFSQAIKLRPDYPYAFNNRGVAYMASGYPDEALSDFNHAIQLQPDFPQAYGNRGNAYLREGHIALAIHDFYRAGKISVGLIAILFCITLILAFLGARVLYRVVPWRLPAKEHKE